MPTLIATEIFYVNYKQTSREISAISPPARLQNYAEGIDITKYNKARVSNKKASG